MSHIYLSYHPEDVDHLLEIHEAFRAANIADAIVTYEGPKPGFADKQKELISTSGGVVFLISENTLSANWLKEEIDFALSRRLPFYVALLSDMMLPAWWVKRIEDIDHYHLFSSEGYALQKLVKDVRAAYETRCPVVSVMNLKGGVGKTTISSQVFGFLQKDSKARILLVDFDPQFNLTQFFLPRQETDVLIEEDRSVLSLFEPGLLTSSVHKSPALDWTRFNDGIFTPPHRDDIIRPLIPRENYAGALDLICGQFELTKYAFLDDASALQLAESNLKRSIDKYRKDYDLIVVDTNPSASFLTQVTLGITDHILAPILPNEFSLRGLRLLDMILNRFCPGDARPEVSVIFNGVPKSQQHRFETDVRDGIYNSEVGYELSESVLTHALYQSAFLDVKAHPIEDNPTGRLAAYNARGPFGSDLKRRLGEISNELTDRIL